MTKEELEKEAKEWLCNNLHSASEEDFIKAMVDIAEPREKRIAELEEQLAISEHDREHNDYELTEVYKKIEELEAQIEKMKCCANCKHSRTEYEHCRTNKHEKWEIKEND